MNITLEPTPELYDAPINGVKVPVRIWVGYTSAGIPIEAYVLTITPDSALDAKRLEAELPPFMVPSRHLFKIDLGSENTDPTTTKGTDA